MNAIAKHFMSGSLSVLVGYCISLVIEQFRPPQCPGWNKQHIMELALFMTGFLTSVLINKLKI